MRWKEGRIAVNEDKSPVGQRENKRLREFPSDNDLWERVIRIEVKVRRYHLEI